MKKITNAFLVSALLMIAAASCKKSTEVSSATQTRNTANSTTGTNTVFTGTLLSNTLIQTLAGNPAIATTNYSNYPYIKTERWNVGPGLGVFQSKSLLMFSLPPGFFAPGFNLIRAKLCLFQDFDPAGFGYLSTDPYTMLQGNNSAQIRAIGPANGPVYNPSTVTWATRPPLRPVQSNIPAIATPLPFGTDDTVCIDVTSILIDMQRRGQNYGMELQLLTGTATIPASRQFGTTGATAPLLEFIY